MSGSQDVGAAQGDRAQLSLIDAVDGGGAQQGPRAVGAASDERSDQEEEGRRALFVRLPGRDADAVARAAFELGVHKQDLIAALVRQYVDATTPEGIAALRRLLG